MKSFPLLPKIFTPLAITIVLSGCVNPINPLGRFDPAPKVPGTRPAPKASEKFAWGISTASYQYEDPAVKPGQPNYFSTDWDVLVSKRKAPPRGNALYQLVEFREGPRRAEKNPSHALSLQHRMGAR